MFNVQNYFIERTKNAEKLGILSSLVRQLEILGLKALEKRKVKDGNS